MIIKNQFFIIQNVDINSKQEEKLVKYNLLYLFKNTISNRISMASLTSMPSSYKKTLK